MEVLEIVKLALGVSHNKKDGLYLGSIQACKQDLKAIGIIYADESDPLIRTAIQLYCQALYSPEAAERVEFKKLYDDLKHSMHGTTGYTRKVEANE